MVKEHWTVPEFTKEEQSSTEKARYVLRETSAMDVEINGRLREVLLQETPRFLNVIVDDEVLVAVDKQTGEIVER